MTKSMEAQKDLEMEVYELRQEIRGLKKLLDKVAPFFKIKYDAAVHAYIIQLLNTVTGEYTDYIIFNCDMPKIDDTFTKYIAYRCLDKIKELEYTPGKTFKTGNSDG